MVSELDYRVGFPVEDWALSQLHARAFAYPSEPPHIQQEPWAARLNRYSLSWVGAFCDADLVGFVHACWDGGRHAFLLDTVVDPHHRRRGAGTGLVLRLIDQVRRAGCEWLHVDYVASLDGSTGPADSDPRTPAFSTSDSGVEYPMRPFHLVCVGANG